MATSPVSRPQQTIQQPGTVSGRGFFTNSTVSVTFLPAEENTGVRFQRTDIADAPEVPALIDFAIDQERRTMLKQGKAEVQLTEHVLAALAGLNIDNCLVQLDGPEIPGMDGSAYPFVEALIDAGIEQQQAEAVAVQFDEPVEVTAEDGSCVRYEPIADADGLTITYILDYGDKSPVPAGTVEFEITPETFVGEISPTRTFIAETEIEALRAAGYGTWVTPSDLLILGPHGPLQNGFRYDDECARHKLLDCVGDFALLGRDLCGKVTATRSGHTLNRELIRQLRKLEAAKYNQHAA
ncbi:UDP-3-O-acyl-N-acetylglucosamine deacetylase [Calycomorphotria hydatis]|uniref:UDP-3-O-acyl-N-acetylglucosamine deacetylase n=1 Tax=Calycomorphotria hydatis TaxID=2528027 RepID=A0A517T3Z3_9PLAN|nr:UDP-3-O-acyl-N-acetylglucosamine deacetylase [Calycomorphotria hydatis]QDT63094.1 UDP-3-O-[3-hydroxymyristoyl] N-acetylglucosamine deacetylase [Calycomorphotria hydatis]